MLLYLKGGVEQEGFALRLHGLNARLYLAPLVLLRPEAADVPRQAHAGQAVKLEFVLEHVQPRLAISARGEERKAGCQPGGDAGVLCPEVADLRLKEG